MGNEAVRLLRLEHVFSEVPFAGELSEQLIGDAEGNISFYGPQIWDAVDPRLLSDLQSHEWQVNDQRFVQQAILDPYALTTETPYRLIWSALPTRTEHGERLQFGRITLLFEPRKGGGISVAEFVKSRYDGVKPDPKGDNALKLEEFNRRFKFEPITKD